jgi:hypothetical protein
MFDRIKAIGWLAVETGLLLIALCLILNVILGQEGGTFIASVAENVTKFMQALPPGVTVGMAMIALLFWFAKIRVP